MGRGRLGLRPGRGAGRFHALPGEEHDVIAAWLCVVILAVAIGYVLGGEDTP
jgi:hypothetical protein